MPVSRTRTLVQTAALVAICSLPLAAHTRVAQNSPLGLKTFSTPSHQGFAEANPLIAPGLAESLCHQGVRSRCSAKERDEESDLDYFGARYFSASLGRFTGADAPFADQNAADPQSWSLYSYVRNNPLRFTDPSGRDCREGLSACGDFFIGGAKAIGNIPSDLLNAPAAVFNLALSPFTDFRFGPVVPAEGQFQPTNRNQREGMESANAVMLVSPLAATGGSKAAKISAAADDVTVTVQRVAPKVGEAGGPGAGKAFPTSVKDAARAESSSTCVFCGQSTVRTPGPTQSNIDHAIPKSRGGNNTLPNAQNTCRTCNLDKGARTTQEFEEELLRHQQD